MLIEEALRNLSMAVAYISLHDANLANPAETSAINVTEEVIAIVHNSLTLV